MNDALVTRMVVGEPRPMTLGRAVGQNIDRTGGVSLRWSGGGWLGQPAPRVGWLARIAPKREPRATLRAALCGWYVRRRWRIALLAVVTVLLVGGFSLGGPALRGRFTEPGELPVAALSSVRVLPSSYSPAGAAPQIPLKEPAAHANDPHTRAAPPPLPFTPPAATAAATPHRPKALASRRSFVPAPKSLAASEGRQAAGPATPASSPRQAGELPAMVLDDATPGPPRAVLVDAREGTRARPHQPSSAAAPTPTMVASAPARPLPAAAPAQLIAITPDGRVAVFSDPKTRLPKQFQLGEQLPGGDVVRSIDAKAGRVLSSTKEYSLD